MKMKKVLLSMSVLLTMPLAMMAGPRSLGEMEAEARKAIPTPAKTARSATRDGLKVLKRTAQTTVLGYEDGGYAVIANDDRLSPVLGYSDSKLGKELPPAMQWWMDAIDESIAKELASSQATRAAADIPEGYAASVAPLMATTWGQEAPYNNLTPVYTTATGNAHYVTGCVATAMSQIMNYHEWPVTGTGSSSYTFTPATGQPQTLTADYGSTTYDWADMLDSYSGTYNDAEANAVATLMYHCGVATEMQYNANGSGTPSVNACNALKTYFGYNENMDIYMRIGTPVNDWMKIVYRELNDKCPVLYSGMRQDGLAHSFVLDGYDENGLVHVNWGWNGEGNGYFDVAQLNGFAINQEMVVVRRPDDTRFTDKPHSRWSINSSMTMSRSSFNVVISFPNGGGLFNSSSFPFSGIVGLVAENLDDHSITQLSLSAIDEAMPLQNVGYNSGFVFRGSLTASFASLPDGEYRLYFASMATGEDRWYPAMGQETMNNNYILTIDGMNISLTAGDPQWTTGISNVAAADKTDGKVRVYTVDGVEIYTAPADGFKVSDIPATGLLIVKDGNKVTKVMKK